MTRPTDDELEAMAQYWDVQAKKAYPLDAMIADEKLGKTATMLRACKGRVRVKALDLSNLLKHAFMSGRESVSGPNRHKSTGAWTEYDPQKCAAYVRILAALEPAPDQGEWNVAIEAAAKVADVKPRKGGKPLSGPHHQGVRDGRAEAARLIRALKKGQTND